MYRELEVAPPAGRSGQDADRPDSPAVCVCQCAEPTPDDVAEAPAGNKSAVHLGLHYDING